MTPPIKLSPADVEWLSYVGPYPFVCNQGTVHWTDHTPEQVIKHMDTFPSRTSRRVRNLLTIEVEASTVTL